MKKLYTILTIVFLGSTFAQAQVAKDAWALGFGLSFPKLTSTNISHSMENFGGFLSVQRNFTEHSGLRLQGNYNSLTGTWGVNNSETTTTTSFWVGLDYIYYLSPCESLSPFFTIGIGGNNYSHDNPQNPDPEGDYYKLELQVGLSFGAEAWLSENWKLKPELGVYSTGTSYFDGTWGTDGGGVIGSSTDAFMKFDFGVVWYFSKGEPSKICQIYDGLEQKDLTDYDRIEEMVKKHIPKEVVREVVIEKEVEAEERIILMGVNFNFNSAQFKPESYPILYHAARVMHENPEIKVEVQGYSDNIGSDKNNLKMSQFRADAVKNYLVARGVDESRIKSVGYGSANPIGDNKDANGRAMNRRIEFKVSR